ncbi:hypothetical protein QBC45DRAFT_159440 [Copromyces sp. CBS 386.78]|nr:hypothetical protein QBC45DRAFT_159440 [Copromyces sp. CBS 386.78]
MADAVSKPVHIVTEGFGALFPEGYLPGGSPETRTWPCPVRNCQHTFLSPQGLGDHFLKLHAGAIIHDHLDGTFSVLPQDPDSANDANRQPYVGSQGRILPSPRPSLRQSSHSIPLHPGPGALDTPAVLIDNHDKVNPHTGNKALASSSEITNSEIRTEVTTFISTNTVPTSD